MNEVKHASDQPPYTPVIAAGGWGVVSGALLLGSLTKPAGFPEWAYAVGSVVIFGIPAFIAAATLIGLPVWRRTKNVRTPDRFYLMIAVALGSGAVIGIIIDLIGQRFPSGVFLAMLATFWCVVAILIGYRLIDRYRSLRLLLLVGLAVVMLLALLAVIL